MKNILIFILLIPVLTGCSSIQRKLYSSNQPNNPSLAKKNDYSLSLTYGSPSGFDVNGGYAISNRIAIIGGLYTHRNRDIEQSYSVFSQQRDSSQLSYRHKGFHAGAGIFMPLQKNNPEWFVSFFAGYTKGNFLMNENLQQIAPAPSSQTNFYKSTIGRWFAQGSINFYDKILHQSFIARFNYVGYDNVTTDYSDYEQYNYLLPPKGYSRWSQFLDLSFDTKIFFTKTHSLGLQFFGTVSSRLNRKDYNFAYYSSRLGIGLVLKPSFKIKEKKD